MFWQLLLYGFATVLAIRTLTTLMDSHKTQYMQKLASDYEMKLVGEETEQKKLAAAEKAAHRAAEKEAAETAA